MKNSFSFARFGLYAKAEMMSSRRLIMLLMGSMMGAFVIIYYLNHLLVYDSDLMAQGFPMSVAGAIGFVWLTIVIVSVINVSRSFKNYFSKGSASATMMLPASLSEKFTYSLILNIIIVPTVLICLAALNDLIWTSAYGIGFSFTLPAEIRSYWTILLGASWTLFGLSQYFLGAVVFRRYQLLFTIIAMNVLGSAVAIIGVWAYKLGLDFEAIAKWVLKSLSQQSEATVSILISVVALALTSGIVAIAWSRFRRLQITK